MGEQVRKSALIAGATGLVGARLLQLLLDDDRYRRVHALVRKPLADHHRKLVQHTVNFDALDTFAWPLVDDVFCCLGTTIKTAGSQPAFYRVDFTYVKTIAEGSLRTGARQFVMVSAMGADPKSRVFYSRVKGEIEAAVSALDFRSVVIVRPSFLAGARAHPRRGERLALALLTPLGPLIPKKYRVVPDLAVARAMIDAAQQPASGVRVIESGRLQAFA
jgi:uncharacterized protein YbjT (DUF2867 family)